MKKKMEQTLKLWENTDDEATLIVKASEIEEELVPNLIKTMEANKLLFSKSKIVLMADAHIAGHAPVGFTMEVHSDYIAPDLISADIGCGLTSYLIKDIELNKDELERIVQAIASEVKINRNVDGTQMGTLGDGNHFIEIGENNGDILITAHSGSRGFGGHVHRKAIRSYEEEQKQLKADKDAHQRHQIEKLKREGREREIQSHIESWKEYDNKTQEASIPYVHIENEYTKAVTDAVMWAKASRVYMLEKIVAIIEDVTEQKLTYRKIESIHNYIDFSKEFPIIRKGSIDAPYGSEVLIPLNMKEGIILGISDVTDEVNYSLPHGAGRKFSRTKAKKVIDLQDFIDEMKDVTSVTVDEQRLDEAPFAYKDKNVILEDITPYLQEYRTFKSILNFKG